MNIRRYLVSSYLYNLNVSYDGGNKILQFKFGNVGMHYQYILVPNNVSKENILVLVYIYYSLPAILCLYLQMHSIIRRNISELKEPSSTTSQPKLKMAERQGFSLLIVILLYVRSCRTEVL